MFDVIPIVGNELLKSPESTLSICDAAAKRALMDKYDELKEAVINSETAGKLIPKAHIHVRFHSLPICPETYKHEFPGSKEVGSFLCLVGTVIRTSVPKLLEFSKMFKCSRCKTTVYVEAIPGRFHAFSKLGKDCPNFCVNSKLIPATDDSGKYAAEYSSYKDYQEIKLQVSMLI